MALRALKGSWLAEERRRRRGLVAAKVPVAGPVLLVSAAALLHCVVCQRRIYLMEHADCGGAVRLLRLCPAGAALPPAVLSALLPVCGRSTTTGAAKREERRAEADRGRRVSRGAQRGSGGRRMAERPSSARERTRRVAWHCWGQRSTDLVLCAFARGFELRLSLVQPLSAGKGSRGEGRGGTGGAKQSQRRWQGGHTAQHSTGADTETDSAVRRASGGDRRRRVAGETARGRAMGAADSSSLNLTHHSTHGSTSRSRSRGRGTERGQPTASFGRLRRLLRQWKGLCSSSSSSSPSSSAALRWGAQSLRRERRLGCVSAWDERSARQEWVSCGV